MLWLWNFFLERRQFTCVFLVALVCGGLWALWSIPKEAVPSVAIPDGFVVVTLPGASAADIETLVTDKLEDQISGIENVDTVTSSSRAGVSEVTVQFDADANVNQSIQDLRDAVSKAVPDLPQDASAPQVIKINLTDQPILVASIAGDLPAAELSNLGTEVSDDLKSITGVSEVDVAGTPPREVDVVVRKEALEQYGLSLSGVIASIASANAEVPAGSISEDGVNYNVDFEGGITSPSQVQNIAVGSKNGTPIYLRDVAIVSNGLAPASTYSRLSLGGAPSEQAIQLTVYKQPGASIARTAAAVRAELRTLQGTTLKGMQVLIPQDTDAGEQIATQLGELSHTGLITVVLVMAVLLLTIGWRESFVAALSIPISFLIAFLALYLTGNTLNFISLFALILAIGILVDSGIVITEAIHARMRIYHSGREAARAALRDYAWPLIAGTMATVAVFAPLFFITGIIGEFIAGIPYTLIFVLLASIFVALGFVPLIAMALTGGKQNRLETLQERYTDRIVQWYERTLRAFLANKRAQRWFLLGLAALFIIAIFVPFSGLVQVVFFPQSDQDYVYVNIEKPEGTVLAQTDLAAREVEELLYHDSDIASFQTTVGESSALAGGADYGQGSSGSNLANITVNLATNRKETSTQIVADLQKRLSVITDASIQVLQPSGSPTSGAPIAIRFDGDNLNDLVAAANKGAQLLATIPHVVNITSSTQDNGTQFELSVDRAKAAALGVSTEQVGNLLRTAINGTKATTIVLPGQDVDVMVKLNLNPAYTSPADTSNTTIDSIENISVQGAQGPVLLGSVLSASLGESNAVISHRDKVREETVSAYPDGHTTTSAVVAAFQKEIGELHLPQGVSVSYGGDTENINQSFSEMFVALIASLVLMFMILMITFNSVRYTLYLLVIVPLSLIGVLDGLALVGQSISFVSLLGTIALGGVIINHAIILMDSMIRRLRAEPEKPLDDIVVQSAATRLRPIILTTVATVIGMVPLALSNPTWGPLAFSIMFGLSFAIVLTLVLVPTLFYRHGARVREKKLAN